MRVRPGRRTAAASFNEAPVGERGRLEVVDGAVPQAVGGYQHPPDLPHGPQRADAEHGAQRPDDSGEPARFSISMNGYTLTVSP